MSALSPAFGHGLQRGKMTKIINPPFCHALSFTIRFQARLNHSASIRSLTIRYNCALVSPINAQA